MVPTCCQSFSQHQQSNLREQKRRCGGSGTKSEAPIISRIMIDKLLKAVSEEQLGGPGPLKNSRESVL